MAEYVDFAEYYDSDLDYLIDIEFYLEFAHQCGSPILELACGTGRVLIPLDEAGFEVHGVDLSENMLKVCRRKLNERKLADRVHLCKADMADFSLQRKDFTLIYIPVRSFMHLFSQKDQLSCLRLAYEHLRPGGYFIVDVYAPSFEYLSQEPDSPFVVRHKFELSNGHHVVRKDRFVRHDIANQINYSEIQFEEFDSAGKLVTERIVPMDTRYTSRYELQLLLERVGFQIVDIFRDYEKKPYDGTGEIIAVARRL